LRGNDGAETFLLESLPAECYCGRQVGADSGGTLVLPVTKINETYQHKHGDYAIESPVLRFQLEHAPFDRGQRQELDAWTGKLYSKVVLLPLKHW
jgi:hypothetical protein